MNDTIYRQAAIDALWKALYAYEDKTEKQFIESGELDVGDWIQHRIFVQNMNDIDRQTILNLPSAQPEQSWIPCSERLPEEDDYKSCIESFDGAVWYFTENGTMGLGYYYESTKEWSTTDDLKTDGKVIAWRPLPEPHQAEMKGEKQ